MRLAFLLLLTLASKTGYSNTNIDTISFWTIRLNGKTIANTNQVLIMYDHAMTIHLSSLSDSDTLDVCFWTDNGSERHKWYLILKDSSEIILDRFTNSVDPTMKSKNFDWYKNYIPFSVSFLKELMKEKNIKKVLMHFESGGESGQNSYSSKNICIIYKD